MRYFAVLLGLGALVACILLLLPSEPVQAEPGVNDVTDVIYRGGEARPEQNQLSVIARNPFSGPDQPVEGWHWKEDRVFLDEFRLLFSQRFSSPEGEEATLDWIMQVTKEKEESGRGKPAVEAYSILLNSGVCFSESGESVFSQLVFGGDLIASNSLRAQAANHGVWVRNRSSEDYHLPNREMSFEPLRFPPEMHFDSMIPGKQYKFPEEMLGEAAALRDHFVSYHAQLYQEQMIMHPSLEFALAECGRPIPLNEKEELFSFAVEEYGKIKSAMQEVPLTYIDGLYSIASAHGFSVE